MQHSPLQRIQTVKETVRARQGENASRATIRWFVKGRRLLASFSFNFYSKRVLNDQAIIIGMLAASSRRCC
jgi:hypothetical protein